MLPKEAHLETLTPRVFRTSVVGCDCSGGGGDKVDVSSFRNRWWDSFGAGKREILSFREGFPRHNHCSLSDDLVLLCKIEHIFFTPFYAGQIKSVNAHT